MSNLPTDQSPVGQDLRKLRLLVAIASHGQKNLELLKRIVRNYRSMALDLDIVVLSESPKELGHEARVMVGLPAKNPWTLPFAHKKVFAENLEQYDLFIYSEDDMEVTRENLQAFLRVQNVLQPDEIAGFIRYENDPQQTRFLPDVLGTYHWKLGSARRRGDRWFAEFTNEHAGFYILTQAQLRRAIASGGFLQAPHDGRYGLPETAATDPYTSCGFRKVVCISELDDFLIHHASNRYVGQVGLALAAFKEQIQTLLQIYNGTHPASTLCSTESKFLHGKWSKGYYEKPCPELLSLVPADAKTILSVGCGWGAAEAALKQRGAEVVALPLDSVIGAEAARRGIDVVYGTFEECLEKLGARQFDCVIISHLLHLQSDPKSIFERCCRFVREGGTLLAAGPNFSRLPTLINRRLGRGDYWKLRRYEDGGINVCAPRTFRKVAKNAGFNSMVVRWVAHKPVAKIRAPMGCLTAQEWILRVRRTG